MNWRYIIMNTIDFEKVALEELKQKQIEMLGFDPEDYYVCLGLIRQNGCNLQYVKEQTPEICLEAVKQNGYALKFVKEQTPEICLAAVRDFGLSLRYVKDDIFEVYKNRKTDTAEQYEHRDNDIEAAMTLNKHRVA